MANTVRFGDSTAASVWAPLLALSAVAWFFVVGEEGAAAGLMGLSPAQYGVGWLVMTTAMMLPPLAWFGSIYVRGIERQTTGVARSARVASLAVGYVLVWSSTAVVALVLASVLDWAAGRHAGALPWIGGAVLVVAGMYQLSPLKYRCLARCRSPLSFALAASRHSGKARDLKVGLEHGAFCVGCCWALMVALVAVGTMSLAWMAAIAAVVLLERSLGRGETLARGVGIGLVLAGLLVPFVEWLAPALHGGGMPMESM